MAQKTKLTILAILSLAILGAVETPQAWPQKNGDTCYTYFGSLSCTAAQSVATLPPTESPTTTATQLPATATQTTTPTTVPPTATQTPTPTATPQPVIHIINGGFETVVNGNPDGWERWDEAAWPDWNSELSPPADSLAVHSGSASVRIIAHHACWRYGIRQTIAAPAGRNVKVTAWFLTLGSQIPSLRNADPNMNSELGIGVDKYGLVDPLGADVSWKFAKGENLVGPLIGGNYEPVWTQMSSTVRVPSDSQLITVFLSLDLGRVRTGNCMWAIPFTIGFIDDVTVEILP